jgi:hypothetical protein
VNRRPLLVSTAAVCALVLCAASSSAGAATATAAKPAAGSASSVLSLVTATVGGHVLRSGDIALLSDTLTGSALSKVVVTPISADGAAVGQQVITPTSPAAAVPSQSSPGALTSLLSLTSPAVSAAATTVPAAHAGATSLGSLSLLGLPVALDGTLDLSSRVSSVTGALGTKTVTLTNLALPSIADLLAALGLDLTKLPVATLNDLVNQLDVVNGAVSAAQAAAGSALAQVVAATDQVSSATTALTSATSGVTSATATLTSATSALQALLTTVPALTLLSLPGANTLAGFLALPPVSQGLVEAVVPGLASALSSYDLAQTAVTAAQALLTTATSALATAQAALATLTATLQSLLGPLQSALTGALDATPLLSLDSLSLTSKAAATSAKSGGQQAEVLDGTVTGLRVLGTDVLSSALGTGAVSLTDLTSTATSALTSAIEGVTGTLSSVLSNVPGFPALSVPAPTVGLLTKSASTSISGGYGRALTDVQGLTLTLPSLSLPTALALPGAASLPALSTVTQAVPGLLTSSPLSLQLLTLSDQAAFRPAVAAVAAPGTTAPGAPSTPGTPSTPLTPSTPSTPAVELPHTGLPLGVAVLSFSLLGGALVLRRRVTRSL